MFNLLVLKIAYVCCSLAVRLVLTEQRTRDFLFIVVCSAQIYIPLKVLVILKFFAYRHVQIYVLVNFDWVLIVCLFSGHVA